MNIRIEKDIKKEHMETVGKGLGNYNRSFTGETVSGNCFVYLKKNDKLVAGINTEYGWNWSEIEQFMADEKTLGILMNVLKKHYEPLVQGMAYMSYNKNAVDLMLANGFKSYGEIKNKPIGHNFHELALEDFTYDEISHDYEVIIVDQADATYDEVIKNWHKEYSSVEGISDDKDEILYIAYDAEQVVGGVYGYINHGYLYVSALWVDETYRHYKLGSRLMDHLEEEAIEKKIYKNWLGTCSFQARPFYEKRGYRVLATFNELPKGFTNWTMIRD